MQRLAITSLALLSSAQGNSLRGTADEKEHRNLYGLEYGIQGFQQLFMDAGLGDQQRAAPVPVEENGLVGRQVHFEPQTLPMGYFGDQSEHDTRVIGGTVSSEQKNFAMHLRFQTSDDSYRFAGCGGTIISNCYVLTAAHCIANDREGLPDALYLNAYNPFQGNLGKSFLIEPVALRIPHPDFDDDSNINDIALLKLETCVQTNDFPPIKLADNQFMNTLSTSDWVHVSGFGKTNTESTQQEETLQKLQLPFISNSDCKDDYYGSNIKNDMICAGFPDGGKDSCQGDSGGPLFAYQGSSQIQVGVVSWGWGCAVEGQPGVYSSVAYHRDWIEGIVCNDPDTDSNTSFCTSAPAPSPLSGTSAFPAAAPVAGSCSGFNGYCTDTADCCGSYYCNRAAHKCRTSQAKGKEAITLHRPGRTP